MKKIHLFTLISIFATASCSLDRTPYDSISDERLSEIEGSLGSVTMGNYSRLKGWVENWHRVTEYPGSNVALSGTTTDNLFYSYNYQRLVTSSRVNNFWEQSYRTIVGTNAVIEQIEAIGNSANDQLLAENLYIRSMLYFYLTNVFGRPYYQGVNNLAVPLKLTSDVDDNTPRATVGQVYDQIEADLLRAEALFVEEKENIYATREAVEALLARIYLYQQRNEEALEYANKVINSGRFSLVTTAQLPNYIVSVPEDNPETIFAIRHVKDVDYDSNGWYTIGSLYANFLGSGWGEMYASRPYLELVRKYPTDVRYSFVLPVVTNASVLWALYVTDNYQYAYKVVNQVGDDYQYEENGVTHTLIKTPKDVGGYDYFIDIDGAVRTVLIDNQLDMRNGYPKYYITKASGQEDQAHLLSPIISRLAEVYLIRAEANAKLGNGQSALDDVNLLRTRAGIPSQGLYTMANLGEKTIFEVVMEERQLELAWEGHHKFDVFRNGLTMDRRYPGTHLAGATPKFTIEPTDPAVVEFIPENQIVLSGGILEQNP